MRLTTLEFDPLFFLARNPGRAFTRDDLMDAVWGYTPALDTGTVTIHVCLRHLPCSIRSIHR